MASDFQAIKPAPADRVVRRHRDEMPPGGVPLSPGRCGGPLRVPNRHRWEDTRLGVTPVRRPSNSTAPRTAKTHNRMRVKSVGKNIFSPGYYIAAKPRTVRRASFRNVRHRPESGNIRYSVRYPELPEAS